MSLKLVWRATCDYCNAVFLEKEFFENEKELKVQLFDFGWAASYHKDCPTHLYCKKCLDETRESANEWENHECPDTEIKDG